MTQGMETEPNRMVLSLMGSLTEQQRLRALPYLSRILHAAQGGGVLPSLGALDTLLAGQDGRTARWSKGDDGLISFTVTSRGVPAAEWAHVIGLYNITSVARDVFSYASQISRVTKELVYEAPTSDVTYNVVVVPNLRAARYETTVRGIRVYVKEMGWQEPHWEVAGLLVFERIFDQLESMGLRRIITMHRPILNRGRVPHQLGVIRRPDGQPMVDSYYGWPEQTYDEGTGFAFVSRIPA